jgi:hypothetical protein
VNKKDARRQHFAPEVVMATPMLPMRKTTKTMSNQNDASRSYTSIEIKYVANTIFTLVKAIDMIISTNAFI